MNNPTRFLGIASACLVALMPLAAYAAHAEFGKSVSIPTTQIVADNEYLAGGQVVFSSTAQKDLVVSGGQVTVNGPVWGDVIAAGGLVQVLDDVRGDVRVAGGEVTIAKNVSGDVVAAGGTVTILPGAVVGGDVIVAGGKVDMEGSVGGSLRAYGGDVTVNGTVAGAASVKAGKSVTFGEKAVFGNVLVYSAPAEATVASGTKLGDKVTFTKSEHLPAGLNIGGTLFAFLGILIVVKFVSILLTALVATYAFRNSLLTLSQETLARFWRSAGIGFLALVATPAAIALLAVSIVGIYVALMLVALYALLLVAGGVYLGILTGSLLSSWLEKEVRMDWKWTTLGTLAVFVVWLVPVLGWLALVVLYSAAVGALATSCTERFREAMQG